MRIPLLALTVWLAAPGAVAQEPADAFFAHVAALCGQAFEGEVLVAPEGDTTFAGERLVMHVRKCTEDVLYIAFHVGNSRSRTWILTRTVEGLRLKHDHRREDGSADKLTDYGGDTASPGTPYRQEFPADAFTARLLPPAATNVWTLEIIPNETFTYALRREGTDRRFRITFDLTRPIDPPPAPWGWE